MHRQRSQLPVDVAQGFDESAAGFRRERILALDGMEKVLMGLTDLKQLRSVSMP